MRTNIVDRRHVLLSMLFLFAFAQAAYSQSLQLNFNFGTVTETGGVPGTSTATGCVYVGFGSYTPLGSSNYYFATSDGGHVSGQLPRLNPGTTCFTGQYTQGTVNGSFSGSYNIEYVGVSGQPPAYLNIEAYGTSVIGTQGIVYAKYVVVGVTYAPPGVSSNVQYSGTTAVGTTSTYSKSFSQGYSVGVSSTLGINIPSGTPTPAGGVTLTTGVETTLTQTQDSSTSYTTSKSTSVLYKTGGYPTTYAPSGTQAPALPHDFDTIQVWLNPELIFTAAPASGSKPASIQWNGYAYDPYDQAGPDIYAVPVGCLNGHFTTTYCAGVQGVLNRKWVVSEPIQQMSPTSGAKVTAAGCAPQTAESPSICPNTQDAYNILASDPLAYNPGGTTYTLFNSQPLPVTTSDGRYTQLSGTNDPNPVQYAPNETEMYTLTQMNTQVQSNGGSTKNEEKITISATVNSGFFNIFNKSTTYTNTDDFTQTTTWLDTLSKTQTIMDAFTITGSTPPNYVPGEFIAYQDNLYGTFLLVPSN